jgi:two-component sensor histidine kinase
MNPKPSQPSPSTSWRVRSSRRFGSDVLRLEDDQGRVLRFSSGDGGDDDDLDLSFTSAPPGADGMTFASRAEAEAYFEARKRVRAMRGFYVHALVYALVIGFLAIVNLLTAPTKLWFFFPMFGWGIGLAAHGLSVFGPTLWLGRDWEERKVQQLLAKEKIRTLDTEKRQIASQLRLLQAQIEPHFLFNTLASVVTLTEVNPQRAKTMLETFIAYLRASLSISRQERTTLAHEEQLLRNYLEILKIRMGQRLDYAIDIAPELRALPFAPMLLQPLVENAVKHGLEPKIDGGRVRVQVSRSAPGRIRALVEDDGLGFDPGHSRAEAGGGGVGLDNLRERLALLYDGSARLSIEDAAPGTRIVLDLPEHLPV